MKKQVFLTVMINILMSCAIVAMPQGIVNEGGTCGLAASLQSLFRNDTLARLPGGTNASNLFTSIRDSRARQVNALAAAIGHTGQNAVAFTYLLLNALAPEEVQSFSVQNNQLYPVVIEIDPAGDVAIAMSYGACGAIDLNKELQVFMFAVPKLGLLAIMPVGSTEVLKREQFTIISSAAIQTIWQHITGVVDAPVTMNAVVTSDAGHGHYVAYVQGAGTIIRCDDASVSPATATFVDSIYNDSRVPRIILYQMLIASARVHAEVGGGAGGGSADEDVDVIAASLHAAELDEERRQEYREHEEALSAIAIAESLNDRQSADSRSWSYGGGGAGGGSVWSCAACTCDNLESDESCTVCGSPRPVRTSACSFDDDESDAELARGLQAVEDEAFAGAFAKQENCVTWACPSCTYVNKSTDVACAMCDNVP